MKIRQISPEDLIPYENNPRIISQEAIEECVKSIENTAGKLQQPVVVDANLQIIVGHTRTQAAIRLGIKKIPVHVADYLTDEQVKTYRIADNKSGEVSEWDFEKLKVEFNQLEEIDVNLELTSFKLDEINDIFYDGEEIEPDEKDDKTPSVPKFEKTVEGDVWILGNHRLMCGDSTSVDAVEKLMNGNKADMVFTDPPYGVSYQSNMREKSEKFDVLKNDDEFIDFLPIIEMFSDGWVFIWTSWKVLDEWIKVFTPFDYPSNIIIWYKKGGGIGDLKKTFSSDYEVALVWHRGHELCGKRIGSVWTIGKDGAQTYVHPTQKPVALAVEAIDKTTKYKNIVLDLFGGSGSTMIACEKTHRNCMMMELDPKYCDVIIKRWQEFTGLDATNESTGFTFNESKH